MTDRNLINFVNRLSAQNEALISDIKILGDVFKTYPSGDLDNLFYDFLVNPSVNLGAVGIYLIGRNGNIVNSYPEKKILEIEQNYLNKNISLQKARELFGNSDIGYVMQEKIGCGSGLHCVVLFDERTKNYKLMLAYVLLRNFINVLCLSRVKSYEKRVTCAALKLIYNFDKDTHMHSYRVGTYSVEIGKLMGFDAKKLKKLKTASMLHDFGKLFIPFDVLKKSGKLTEEEFSIVKKHTTIGEKILRSFGIVDEEILETVKHHHEKLDGSGYPEGKIDVCDICWVVKVADILDALQSSRSYKDPVGHSSLVGEFQKLKKHLPERFIRATVDFLESDRFYICRRRILEQQGNLKLSERYSDVYETINLLKSESAGLKREVSLYRKIIEKQRKKIDKFSEIFFNKKSEYSIELLMNYLEKTGRLISVVVLKGESVAAVYRNSVSLRLIECCIRKIDKCTVARKPHYFYYFKVEDDKLICAIYDAKPEKLLSDFLPNRE